MPESASERLVHSTARIVCYDADGLENLGTGFWFRFAKTENSFVAALVTNKHVVANAVRCIIYLTNYDRQDQRQVIGSNFAVELGGEENWIMHPDQDVDLAVISVSTILTDVYRKDNPPRISFFEINDLPRESLVQILPPLVDIVMTGYPIGIWDSTNNMPILRRGITATAYNLDYEGKAEFVIDAACFPGSSGSPVCLVSEGQLALRGGLGLGGSHFALLGILYAGPQFTAEGTLTVETIPTSADKKPITRIPSNLGMCINANQLLAFERIFNTPPA
jgi:hypothetical protein